MPDHHVTGPRLPAQLSRMPRLSCSRLSEPGITRMRRGRGFCYIDPKGEVMRDPEERQRINDLVIPPAWEEVWVCPDPDGHIQAVGYDDAGRKQYIYHPNWRAKRDREKFRHMIEFAHCLPQLRRRTKQCLMEPGVGEERVLAAAVRMLDRGLLGSAASSTRPATPPTASRRCSSATCDHRSGARGDGRLVDGGVAVARGG